MKKIIKLLISIIIIISFVILTALYVTNANFRLEIDKIFNKEISSENLKSIEINSEENPVVYAYDNYIVVLTKGILKIYNSNGDNVSTLDINISLPIITSSGKYLVIAEKGGSDFCVISENAILWQDKVEGSISKINVNSNGYISVILANTTYKSVVSVYNSNGTKIFNTYLSSTYAICSDISSNNKYLAIGEIDYTGTVIKSKVKIVSIDLAKTDPKNSIINSYESDYGEIITNVNYQISDNVYCMFSNYIQNVNKNSNERVLDFNNDTLFVDIYMKNNIVVFEKQNSGLFSSEYQLKMINIITKKETKYMEGLNLIKSLHTSNDHIVLNFVNGVQILNKNGWLIKNYKSNKEIKDIVVSDGVVGIICKDKIEVIQI